MAKKKRKTKEQRIEGLLQFLRREAKRMRLKPSKWESILKKHLSDLGYKFKCQVPIIVKEKGYIVDFLLTDYNIFIEADGRYHNQPKQRKLDNLRTRRLKKEGYECIRLTNSQISVFTKEQIKQIIELKIALINEPLSPK